MGKQYNKIVKRRRRAAYLDRKSETAKLAAKPKPKARVPKKAAATPTAPAPTA